MNTHIRKMSAILGSLAVTSVLVMGAMQWTQGQLGGCDIVRYILYAYCDGIVPSFGPIWSTKPSRFTQGGQPAPDPPIPPPIPRPPTPTPPPDDERNSPEVVLPFDPPHTPADPVVPPPIPPPQLEPADPPAVNLSGYFIDTTDGVVWYHDGPAGPWNSPLEGRVPRPAAEMEERVTTGVMLRVRDAEQDFMANAIRDRNMRGKTFIAQDGSEWLCPEAAGLLVKLDMYEVPPPAKIVLKNGSLIVYINLRGVHWRSPVTISPGPTLGLIPPGAGPSDITVTADGISLSRSDFGIVISANNDATAGERTVSIFNHTFTLQVHDPAAGNVTVRGPDTLELGTWEYYTITPGEALIRVEGHPPLGGSNYTLYVPNSSNPDFKIERSYDGISNSITPYRIPPGGTITFTAVGTPPSVKTITVVPMSRRLLLPPSLAQGTSAGGYPVIQPGADDIVIRGPVGTERTLRGVNETNRTQIVIVDGVTYTRTLYETLTPGVFKSNVAITAAVDAPLGEHAFRFADGAPTPTHVMMIVRPTTRLVIDSSPDTGPVGPPHEQPRQRYGDDDRLPDPRAFERPADGRPYTPDGTIRIDTNGVAWRKFGEANFGIGDQFNYWERLANPDDMTDHEYMQANSAAQVNASEYATMRTAEIDRTVGVTVTDIFGKRWVSGHFGDPAYWGWGWVP